jgi:hypothetical protein
MKWFRGKIRRGTSLALLALAINLTLSFGHIHLDVRDLPSRHDLDQQDACR